MHSWTTKREELDTDLLEYLCLEDHETALEVDHWNDVIIFDVSADELDDEDYLRSLYTINGIAVDMVVDGSVYLRDFVIDYSLLDTKRRMREHKSLVVTPFESASFDACSPVEIEGVSYVEVATIKVQDESTPRMWYRTQNSDVQDDGGTLIPLYKYAPAP